MSGLRVLDDKALTIACGGSAKWGVMLPEGARVRVGEEFQWRGDRYISGADGFRPVKDLYYLLEKQEKKK